MWSYTYLLRHWHIQLVQALLQNTRKTTSDEGLAMTIAATVGKDAHRHM